MTPRPLYRWKSFWFGLLVLAFLAWAWAHSTRQGAAFVPTRKSPVVFLQDAGRIRIAWFRRSSPFPQGLQHFPPGDGSGRLWFAPMVEVIRLQNQFYIHLAHWFLILLFALPWSSFLIVRSRRMKRLTAPPP
ncbi:hypothetical protein [Luteolibacter soli]|uniref:PepSY domain-containing protein n=1 Tax=Luteolibacter soli TaxID=3135280 RepID=A0ABU9AVG1_9BACT